MPLRGRFIGFVDKAERAATNCLIMADHDRYRVDGHAYSQMGWVRSHAERIVVQVVADHRRNFPR